MHIVQSYVKAKGMIPDDQVAQEVDLFYNHLGIDDMYFEQETPESVGDNIILLYGAKIQGEYLLDRELFSSNPFYLYWEMQH